MFPVIRTIDDVLPHIKGNDNFSINNKDGYIVIDYILNTPDLFKNEIEKECRGIIFGDDDGKLIARRLHKFFNFNERPESSIENIDFSKDHWILEKLDGSMITPFRIGDRLTWGSKAGETFLTPQIEKFVADHPTYRAFAVWCIDNGLTPIFEWCTRQNRIVIDYPEDRLVLIAMRWNDYGDYATYGFMEDYSDIYNIDIVKEYPGNVQNMKAFAEQVANMSGIEGFVIRFIDGQMIKIKCAEYIRYHRAKDSINLEKNVVAIIVNNQADDFRTLLSETDRNRFEIFEDNFMFNVKRLAINFNNIRHMVYESGVSRKDYSLGEGKWHSKELRSIIFDMFEEYDVSDFTIVQKIFQLIKSKVGSATDLDKVRHLWGGFSWYDF